MIKLSILICTIQSRRQLFKILFDKLCQQTKPYWNNVQILVESDNGERTIGDKRNELLDRATGEYLCFVDDDDSVSENYISKLMEAIESKPDCCSLKGIITFDGKNPEVFEHSLKYNEWKTNSIGSKVRYERYPNHLNCINSFIAKQFKYPEKNFGEDFDWSKLVHESGLLKSEAYIPDILYYYKYVSNK